MKKCKCLLSKDPIFLDVSKIKKGMKLKIWFETTYEPKVGKYSPCDGYHLIRRVDGDLIFYSHDGYTEVLIGTRERFLQTTIEK